METTRSTCETAHWIETRGIRTQRFFQPENHLHLLRGVARARWAPPGRALNTSPFVVISESRRIESVLTPPTWSIREFPDNGAQFARSENSGWVNAEPDGDGGPGMHIAEDWVRGWLWSENIGWVSLSCANTAKSLPSWSSALPQATDPVCRGI